MILALARVRLLQLSRVLNNLGIGRSIFLAFLILFLFAATFTYSKSIEGAYLFSALYYLVILTIHLKRNDHEFLKCHVESYNYVYFHEYMVSSLPLLISLFIHGYFGLGLSFIFLIIITTFIHVKKRVFVFNTRIQELIPAELFEWKAGIRKNFVTILLIWVISLITSFWVGSSLIAIIIIGLLIANFNNQMESLPMLLAFESRAKKLLLIKITHNFKFFFILILPQVFTYLILHSSYWYILVIIFALVCMLISYSIIVKYAFYEPNANISVNQTFTALGTTGILLPAFIPVTIALFLWFYFKAIKNLNFYLNDYN